MKFARAGLNLCCLALVLLARREYPTLCFFFKVINGLVATPHLVGSLIISILQKTISNIKLLLTEIYSKVESGNSSLKIVVWVTLLLRGFSYVSFCYSWFVSADRHFCPFAYCFSEVIHKPFLSYIFLPYNFEAAFIVYATMFLLT